MDAVQAPPGLWWGEPSGGTPRSVVWGTPRTVVEGTQWGGLRGLWCGGPPGCGGDLVGGPPGLWCGDTPGCGGGDPVGGTPGLWCGGPGDRGAQVRNRRGSGVTFSGGCMSAPLTWRLGSEGDSRKPLRRLVRPPEEPRPSGLTSAQAVGRVAGQVSCPVPPGPGNQLRSAPRRGWDPRRTQFLSGGPLAGRPRRGPPGPLPLRPRKAPRRLWRLFIVLGAGWRGSRTLRRAGPRVPGPPPRSSSCAGAPLGRRSRLARPAPTVGAALRAGGACRMGGAPRVCWALGSCGPGRPALA